MKTLLVSWVGSNDLNASSNSDVDDIGAIARTLSQRKFHRVILLYGYGDERRAQFEAYIPWLKQHTNANIETRSVNLKNPTDLGELYEHVKQVLDDNQNKGWQFSYHISSGSKSMAALWIMIGKAIYPGEILESHPESGVTRLEMPFDFKMEVARRLETSTSGQVPEGSNFESIIHQCAAMRRVVKQARLAAEIPVTVLLEGDSGTGKELFANAIHASSPRGAGAFVAVNCGAIPQELLESELFGHAKGAFTGAMSARKGLFEQANGGTLFLDEVGELPLEAQVKLLRALNERKIRPVGSNKSSSIDVRIVAATHRKLHHEVAAGRFREDLFYRLAVAVIKLPRLRERGDDIELIVNHLMASQDSSSSLSALFEGKTLSEGAWNVIKGHTWPGNIRELANTLTRAALWSQRSEITEHELTEALLPMGQPAEQGDILGRALFEGFQVREVLDEVKRHYIAQALTMTNHNKSKAARLLGLKNQQTLTNWMEKSGFQSTH